MDVNTQELEAAAAVLRQQFGNRLEGSLDSTQAQMRRALEQSLGVDEVASDRLVKQLTHTGRLVYRGGDNMDDASGEAGFLAGPDTGLGMIATPNMTGGAGPDVAGAGAGQVGVPVAAANSAVTVTPTLGAGLAGTAPHGIDQRSTADTEDAAPIGAGISPGESNRAYAENRTGATAGGQLADTNVVGPSSPSEQVVAGGDDDRQGYWQIA